MSISLKRYRYACNTITMLSPSNVGKGAPASANSVKPEFD